MRQILIYGDSLSWGLIPGTRQRLPFEQRWPGVLERALGGPPFVRVIEDCLNGRRTVWDDPFKPGRNGLVSLAQRVEAHSPLDLVVLMLGTNDFQSMHEHNAWHASQGMHVLVTAVRTAPIEPGMPVPPVLVIAPPPLRPPRGPIAPKFDGGDRKCVGLSAAYEQVCDELGCLFLDAASVVQASPIDGVHLDRESHEQLGRAVSRLVRPRLQTPDGGGGA